MTVSYCANSNYLPSMFSVNAPISIEGGILKAPDFETKKEEDSDNKNKILNFKTGEYVDYTEYLLDNTKTEMKYLA